MNSDFCEPVPGGSADREPGAGPPRKRLLVEGGPCSSSLSLSVLSVSESVSQGTLQLGPERWSGVCAPGPLFAPRVPAYLHPPGLLGTRGLEQWLGLPVSQKARDVAGPGWLLG